jgi:hypothetical protein
VEIRRYRESDRAQLVALWRRAFPDDPPRNEPNRMIDAKLRVDDLIFVAVEQDAIIGAAIAGYEDQHGTADVTNPCTTPRPGWSSAASGAGTRLA